MDKKEIKKIALAYSGGLDTSIIIPWLKENYPGAEIIGVCVNVGQEEDWQAMRVKAAQSGAVKLVIADARDQFADDYLFAMLRSGAVYEGKYLLGTSIARPLQAKIIAETALREGADAVAHGCTGKGNDQVRFEMTIKALAPGLRIIAPWRLWDIGSREQAIEYAKTKNVPLGDISTDNIYSRDWNMWHMSHEGDDLEDPCNQPQESVFKLSVSPQMAPDKETLLTIDFEKAIPRAVNGKKMTARQIIEKLNEIGGQNGIGRADLVENRVVGIKSRCVYETPAGAILLFALKDLESLTLDRETMTCKNLLSQKYADLIYEGKWFTPLRYALEAFMEKSSEHTSGVVKIALYKGNLISVSRQSDYSLYNQELVSFGESSYDHCDANGFLNLYTLPAQVAALAHDRSLEPKGV